LTVLGQLITQITELTILNNGTMSLLNLELLLKYDYVVGQLMQKNILGCPKLNCGSRNMIRHVLGTGVGCAEGFELHSSFPSMHDTYNTLHAFTTTLVKK